MSKARNLIALIVAAGSGQRARMHEKDPPKQYQILGGQILINHSLKVFLAHPHVTHVQVVYDPHHHTFYEEALKTLRLPPKLMGKLLPPVAGGHIRQESVHAGLRALAQYPLGENPAILVHDGARPFVSQELIDRAQSALTTSVYGAIPTLPVTDTVKRVDRGGMVC